MVTIPKWVVCGIVLPTSYFGHVFANNLSGGKTRMLWHRTAGNRSYGRLERRLGMCPIAFPNHDCIANVKWISETISGTAPNHRELDSFILKFPVLSDLRVMYIYKYI